MKSLALALLVVSCGGRVVDEAPGACERLDAYRTALTLAGCPKASLDEVLAPREGYACSEVVSTLDSCAADPACRATWDENLMNAGCSAPVPWPH